MGFANFCDKIIHIYLANGTSFNFLVYMFISNGLVKRTMFFLQFPVIFERSSSYFTTYKATTIGM